MFWITIILVNFIAIFLFHLQALLVSFLENSSVEDINEDTLNAHWFKGKPSKSELAWAWTTDLSEERGIHKLYVYPSKRRGKLMVYRKVAFENSE
jgi:hypothetical protein